MQYTQFAYRKKVSRLRQHAWCSMNTTWIDMERKDRKTAKSTFPASIYLLHTELNGEIPCNLYMLYKVSVHTVFNRVYSPVSAGEGMEERLAIATGGQWRL